MRKRLFYFVVVALQKEKNMKTDSHGVHDIARIILYAK